MNSVARRKLCLKVALPLFVPLFQSVIFPDIRFKWHAAKQELWLFIIIIIHFWNSFLLHTTHCSSYNVDCACGKRERAQDSLKLTSKIDRICEVHCSVEKIHMHPKPVFFTLNNIWRHPVDNEVSTLARLTFCENLLIRQEKFSVVDIDGPSVLSGLNLEKRWELSSGTRKTVRHNEVFGVQLNKGAGDTCEYTILNHEQFLLLV